MEQKGANENKGHLQPRCPDQDIAHRRQRVAQYEHLEEGRQQELKGNEKRIKIVDVAAEARGAQWPYIRQAVSVHR